MSASVWYQLQLQDGHVLAEDKLSASVIDVSDLRKAVYLDNKHKPQLQQCDHTDLHVYPPSTTDLTQPAVPPKRKISELLRQSDDAIIVVARPPQPSSITTPSSAVSHFQSIPAHLQLTNFFTALATVPEDANQIIDLQQHILLDPSLPSQMYVRDCYVELYDAMIDARNDMPSRSLIVGTPGIGKTMLGLYVIRRLLSARVQHQFTVIYQTSLFEDGSVFVVLEYDPTISPQLSVCKMKQSTFEDINVVKEWTRNQNNWFIVDGVTIDRAAGTTCNAIGLASPLRNESYNEYKKNQATIRYFMPVWSVEEMQRASDHIYSTQKPYFEPLMDVYGPIPRHVFSRRTVPVTEAVTEATEQVRNAINDASMSNLLQAFRDVTSPASVRLTHYILHMHCPPLSAPHTDNTEELLAATRYNYRRMSLRFAAPWVGQAVYDRIKKSGKAEMGLLLSVVQSHSGYGSLRGTLFEQFVHDTFINSGGTFRMRELVSAGDRPANPEPITLVKCPRYHTWNHSVLELQSVLQPNDYALPKKSNEPAVDSVRYPSDIYQITVAEAHPVIGHRIQEACTALDSAQARLIFVVPSDIFDAYIYKQSYTVARRGGSSLQRIPHTLKQLKQYVLAIETFPVTEQ